MNSDKVDQKTRLLIEYDALMDTRAGTVRTMYPDVVDSLLENKAYRMRKDDLLNRVDPRINLQDYTFRYIRRDMEVLDNSRPSMMISYIHSLIEKIQGVIESNNPIVVDCKVVLNIFPYKVTDDEAKLIGLAATVALGLNDPIDTVSLSPKQITLDYLEENNFMAYICYDFNAWTAGALPDAEGKDLPSLGLRRYENLTIYAAKIASDGEEEDKVKQEFANMGMGDMFDEMIVMPWNLLFELELIDPIMFTEYDPKLAEHLMSVVEKSTSPIDLEVGLIADFHHLMSLTTTLRGNIMATTTRMSVVAAEIKDLLNFTGKDESEKDSPSIIGKDDKERLDKLRVLLAEQRFLTDYLSVLIPSQPSLDFERFMDSTMSNFDVNLENSNISEDNWNRQRVKCRRISRDIKTFNSTVYILVAAEDCTDANGVFRNKNTLLPSVMSFPPVLEPMPEPELDTFISGVSS